MIFRDWQARCRELRARADRLSERGRLRANGYARAAGLPEGRNVWHNALLAREDGRPWARVDYSLLRRAIREDTARDRAHQVVDAWVRRTWPAVLAEMEQRLIAAMTEGSRE